MVAGGGGENGSAVGDKKRSGVVAGEVGATLRGVGVGAPAAAIA